MVTPSSFHGMIYNRINVASGVAARGSIWIIALFVSTFPPRTMSSNRPGLGVNEAARPPRAIPWQEIRAIPIDERQDDIREIAQHLRKQKFVSQDELSIIFCAVRRYSGYKLPTVVLHRFAFSLMARHEQGQPYDIEAVLTRIDARFQK